MQQPVAHTLKYSEANRMSRAEQEAYRRGFEKAKAECIQVVDEWSRACHPSHPKTSTTRNRCWQHHGLQAAKRSIKRDVFLIPFVPR